MKELFLIRHAQAQHPQQDCVDPVLSDYGVEQLRYLRTELSKVPSTPEIIFHSPLKRAVQTATSLNQYWKTTMETVTWLSPGVSAGKILDELQILPQRRIALVSHLPSLGWLLSTLLWGVPKDLDLDTASLIWLELPQWQPGCAHVRFQYSLS